MNPKIKQLWVDALRSGFYKQGRHKMRDTGDFFDPLGVLCDLAVLAGIIPQPTKHDRQGGVFFGYIYGTPDDRYATGLPKAVCEWADITFYSGHKVALMGDHGKSFDKLADWIDKNL